MRLPLALLALAVFGACRAEPDAVPVGNSSPPAAIVAIQTSPVSGLPLLPLQIRSGRKTHRFTVEVARTDQEQAYGLMNRARLGPDEGMLFPFAPARPASFWMKNTLIPLDMIFVRADGSIARIAANTIPHSLEPVSVSEPVVAVLEVRGGRSAELGIAAQDRVSWPGGPTP
jgi:uncharacterized membrane protein (UPF0127 family)